MGKCLVNCKVIYSYAVVATFSTHFWWPRRNAGHVLFPLGATKWAKVKTQVT